MATMTYIFFCFAGLVVITQGLPLDAEKQHEDGNYAGLEDAYYGNPVQDMLGFVLRSLGTQMFRPLHHTSAVLPTNGLSSSQTLITGSNTAFTGATPNLLVPIVGTTNNKNGFGNAFMGSVIGSALATMIPHLINPKTIALIKKGLESIHAEHNYDAQFMNLPGSKDAYLYLTLSPQAAEDGDQVVGSRESAFEHHYPYQGPKIGTVNIKAPPSTLEISDSLRQELLDYENYEDSDSR